MTTETMPERPVVAPPTPVRRYPGVRAAALAMLVMLVAEILRVFAGSNFDAVAPGRCYRSAQPTARWLRSLLHTHGIRAVVNLRGDNRGTAWYREEVAAAAGGAVCFRNAGLWTYSEPAADELRVLVAALEEAPEPILIHCASGSDRTGLASALYLLLRTGATPDDARRQLSLRYGHWSWGRAGCQDRVLDHYVRWLADQRLSHAPRHLRHWAYKVYEPGCER
jgi:protein tyrosine phosphatase (PTP) superfamily phosphohydrolase (DUF442 family)